MPNMYSRIIIHTAFSTRYRKKLIRPEIESALYGYMGATINGLECKNIIVNGYQDHVHSLFHCPARLAPSDVIRELKKASGAFAREQLAIPGFYWQGGGGAFSVDHRHLGEIILYIEDQYEHHRTTKEGFDEEYPRLLRANAVDYEDRYLLDPPEEEEV